MKKRDHFRCLVLLGLLASASIALAQIPGTFAATGNMTAARVGHTATLLADGRVLIAGGTQGPGSSPQASAELYDPATGAFSATGNMTSARAGHTATLLPDGRVLVTGGSADSLASAELYDPFPGTFSATASMKNIQYPNTATLVADGQVLITGTPFGGGVPVAEIYDPGTATFAAAGKMTVPPPFDTATLLPDGRVLLATYYWGSSELYDPRAGTFSPTSSTNAFESTATLLINGMVLVTGGIGDPGPDTRAEVYDPSTGIFTITGNMTVPRDNHTVTLLPDGKALITGGGTWIGWGTGGPMYSSCCLSGTELYDPATGIFVSAGSMGAGRAGHTATLLGSGNVLIAGGNGDGGVPATAELYHPVAPIPAPVLLSLSGDGKGQGAIQHAGTTRIASADDPAVAGEYLSIYLNGLADGSVIPPQVAIGGRLAEITFFGNVPGSPGLNVVNVRMPSGVAPGPTVPVRLTYLGRPSNQVTIGVTEVALQQAVAAMKAAAGTDSLNFWQWSWYWQNLTPFSGAPAGFGVGGSISPDVMAQITAAGGGDPLRNISAEQWVFYYRGSAIAVSGIVNAASHLGGAIAPGELILVAGSGLGPAQVVSADPHSDGPDAAQLAGTAVLVNGTPAPLIYTSASQLEAIVPDSVAGGTAQVTVTYLGRTSSFSVSVAPTAPGIFTQDGTGQGHAATINQKGAINVPAHWEGDVMTLFLTGTGLATSTAPFYGGEQLPITPGPTPGIMQIKVPISHGTDCDLPVVFQVGNATTQPGVTIAVDICI